MGRPSNAETDAVLLDGAELSIPEIKARIHRMTVERAESESSSALPSQYWKDFCQFFEYMMDLSEESFGDIRLHTYHLTGDNYQSYYLRHDPSRWRRTSGADELVRGLPEGLVLDEPEGGIGLRFPDGRFISGDVLRYQRVVRTLHQEGALSEVASRPRATVLEIGGGYGGLAHHLGRILPNATYLILDLPETLLFSAAYLAMQNPDARIYLYRAEDWEETLAGGFTGYDFVLVPNYRLDGLRGLRFDLVINVESLQEMTEAQVTEYAQFLHETCAGTFYCWNMDRNPRNEDLTSLYAILERYFSAKEVDKPPVGGRARLEAGLRWAARKLHLMDTSKLSTDLSIRECICTPRTIQEGRP